MNPQDQVTLDGQPIVPATNGHAPALTAGTASERLMIADHRAILADQDEVLAKRHGYRTETELEVQRREGELEALRNHRHAARMDLSVALGHFGYAYDPKTNTLVRSEIASPGVPIPPSAPLPVREPFDPAKYGLPTQKPGGLSPKLLKWLDGVAWFAVLPLGAFIGYSIGHLAGLRVEAEPMIRNAAVVFGIAILATMKGSLYAIVHHAARRSKMEGRRSIVWLAFAFAALMVAAEAGLGTVAIQKYSEDRALNPSEVLPWYAALLIALCFSTPILVASIVKGWAEGREHDDRTDAAIADAERYHRENAEALRQHEEAQIARNEAARKEHDAALARFEAANAEHRNDPRWQAAMSLFGAISSYDLEIEERKRLLDNYKISRGYGDSALRKES